MNLNFAENFKTLRKTKNITQEKIAEILGVTGQSVSRWEMGICYPDLELLPIISNYFGVSIDHLLSNDADSKESNRAAFNKKLDFLSDETPEKINYVSEYCRLYPDDEYYSYHLVAAIREHLVINRDHTDTYMPIMLKHVQGLLDTRFRDYAILMMTQVCAESELKKWLDLSPYSSFSRRICLISRATSYNDLEEAFIQRGLETIETFAYQLDRRYPDSFGAPGKARYHSSILKTIRSFSDNDTVPDGWKLFYAYKQLVLSACLFACGEAEAAWNNFDAAIDLCRYIYLLDDEWLEIGGELFAGIKVSKDWNYAIDERGRKHKLFRIVNLSRYNAEYIYDLLTNPCWAWFDSVRGHKNYIAAVDFIKCVLDKQRIS